jgi:hypothetical protein
MQTRQSHCRREVVGWATCYTPLQCSTFPSSTAPRQAAEIEVERFGLLAGPYVTHQEAIDKVDVVRKIAKDVNVWAHFYAFGTCKLREPINGAYPPGRLNHLLCDPAGAKNSSADS